MLNFESHTHSLYIGRLGGVTISRHNEVHDLLAGLLMDVCHMLPWNPTCNHCLGGHYPYVVPQLRTTPSWTLQKMDPGEDDSSKYSLM